jgi:hypothetical protein
MLMGGRWRCGGAKTVLLIWRLEEQKERKGDAKERLMLSVICTSSKEYEEEKRDRHKEADKQWIDSQLLPTSIIFHYTEKYAPKAHIYPTSTK